MLESAARRVFPTELVFTTIKRFQLWGRGESVSGPGSTLAATENIRQQLPSLIADYGIRTILDAPCGDCHWIREVELGIERYIGCDIVKSMIDENRRVVTAPSTEFLHANIIRDPLPRVDLIMCRDCLIHFSVADIFSTLRNFRESQSEYLLVTTHRRVRKNRPLVTGLWRRINLEKGPFNFPAPLAEIAEPTPVGSDREKVLALWRIAELPI